MVTLLLLRFQRTTDGGQGLFNSVPISGRPSAISGYPWQTRGRNCDYELVLSRFAKNVESKRSDCPNRYFHFCLFCASYTWFFSPHFLPDVGIHPVPLLIFKITIPATFGLLSACRWVRIIGNILMALSFSLFVFCCIWKSLYPGYLE